MAPRVSRAPLALYFSLATGGELRFFKPNTTFPNGPNIIQRLGLIIWWSGLAVAVALLCIAAFAIAEPVIEWIESPYYDLVPHMVARIEAVVRPFVFAIGVWLTARAVLYLLAAR